MRVRGKGWKPDCQGREDLVTQTATVVHRPGDQRGLALVHLTVGPGRPQTYFVVISSVLKIIVGKKTPMT